MECIENRVNKLSIFSLQYIILMVKLNTEQKKDVHFVIGLGKWTGDIETSVISGNAIVEITDNNGEEIQMRQGESILVPATATALSIVPNGKMKILTSWL